MRRGIQLAVACLVLLVTAAVQAGVVYTNDFQSGTATGFTGFTNVETAPNTERFIGFLVSGNSAVLSLSGLAPHSTVTLEFDVIGLHSLDGITSGDNFQLFRNGGLEFTDFYGHSGGTIIGPTTGTLLSDDPSAFGYGSFFAGAVTYHYSLIFNDSASSISFAFQGNTNQTWNDEAFGLDNVVVTTNTLPSVVPEPNSLAIFGTCTLGMIGIGCRRRKKQSASLPLFVEHSI